MELKRLREEFDQSDAEFDRIRRKRDKIWANYERRISIEIQKFAKPYLANTGFKIVGLNLKVALYTIQKSGDKILVVAPSQTILTEITPKSSIFVGELNVEYKTVKRILDFIEWPLEIIIRRKSILLLLAKWRQSDLGVFPRDIIILILQRVWRGN